MTKGTYESFFFVIFLLTWQPPLLYCCQYIFFQHLLLIINICFFYHKFFFSIFSTIFFSTIVSFCDIFSISPNLLNIQCNILYAAWLLQLHCLLYTLKLVPFAFWCMTVSLFVLSIITDYLFHSIESIKGCMRVKIIYIAIDFFSFAVVFDKLQIKFFFIIYYTYFIRFLVLYTWCYSIVLIGISLFALWLCFHCFLCLVC